MGISSPLQPRFVSLVPGYTEAFFAMGLGDYVVGRSHQCDFPNAALSRPATTRLNLDLTGSSRAIDDVVQLAVKQSTPIYQVEIDLLKELAPTVIVVQSQCDVCAIDDQVLAKLAQEHAWLNNVKLFPVNPTSVEELWSDFTQLAEFVPEAREAADKAIGRWQARLRRVENEIPSARPKVICVEWLDPLMIAANMTPELIERAGGESGIGIAGERSRYHSWDEVTAYDPDVMIVAPCGYSVKQTKAEMGTLESLPFWSELKCVRSDQVHIVDGNVMLHRYGPRLVDSVEQLAQLFHRNDVR